MSSKKFSQRIEKLIFEGKFLIALRLLERHESITKLPPKSKIQFKLYKSILNRNLGENDKSLSYAEEVIEQAEEIKDNRLLFDALLEKLWVFSSQGKIDEMPAIIHEAEAKINRKIKSRKFRTSRIGYINYFKGLYFNFKGERDQSLEFYELSKKQFEKAKNNSLIAKVMNSISNVYSQKNKIHEAMVLNKKALTIQEKIGNPLEIALALDSLAYNYLRLDDLKTARDYFLKCLSIYQKIGNIGHLSKVYNSLGTVYDALGKLNKAQQYYERSLGLLKKIGNEMHIGALNINLGNLFRRKGKFDKALDCLQTGLNIFQKVGNTILIINCFYQIGIIYYQKGKLDDALINLEMCYQLREQMPVTETIMGVLFYLIQVLIEKQDLAKARDYYKSLEKLVEKQSDQKLNPYLQTAKALLLKTEQPVDYAKIKSLLKEIVTKIDYNYELILIALFNICQITIDEIYTTGKTDLLDSIKDYLDLFELLAKKYKSVFLLAEAYWLRAQIALIVLETQKAQELLKQALLIAEEFDIEGLAKGISDDYDKLLEAKDEITTVDITDSTILERFEKAQLDQFFANVFLRDLPVEEAGNKEEPIILLIITDSGRPIYTHTFPSGKKLDDILIGSLLNAIEKIIYDAFKAKGPVSHIKYKDYNIAIQSMDNILYCYIFKGKSYFARKRLEKLSILIQPGKKLWTAVEGLAEKGKPFDENENKEFKEIISEIFP